jgi:hypothetical protein
MLGSNVIEVGIGLLLMYFLLSLICSTITELITRAVDMRAKTLVEGIRNLLKNPTSLEEVKKHLVKLQEAILKLSDQSNSDTSLKELADDLASSLTQRLTNDTLDELITKLEKDIQKCLQAPGIPKPTKAAIDTSSKAFQGAIRLHTLYAEEFYAHPLIARLRSRERSSCAGNLLRKKDLTQGQALPYYVSPKDFALVLLDLLAPANPAAKPKTIVEIQTSIAALPDGDLRRSLSALVNEAEGDLKKLHEGIERWFNDTMDCVQGWYRRKAQWIILGVAFVVTVCANADTLTTAGKLSSDAAFRGAAVAAAATIVQEQPVPSAGGAVASIQKLQDLQNRLSSLGYPIGWRPAKETTDPRRIPSDVGGVALKLIGLLLTTFLVSLGAPFWFDMLNKLVNLRAAGKPPSIAEPDAAGVDELTKQVADLKALAPKLDELTKQVAGLGKTS